jgi:hypothetical protein
MRLQDTPIDHGPRTGAMQAPLTQQPRHHTPVQSVGAFRGIKAFTIEVHGNLRTADAVATEGVDPGQELRRRRQRCIPGHRAEHAMVARHATRPMQRHVHLFAVIWHIDTDAIQQQADDLLPLLRRHIRRMPQSRHVFR